MDIGLDHVLDNPGALFVGSLGMRTSLNNPFKRLVNGNFKNSFFDDPGETFGDMKFSWLEDKPGIRRPP